MHFDGDALTGFRQIINDGLAHGMFLRPDAVRESADGRHISLALFREPRHVLQTVLKLVCFHIKKGKTRSVIGLTENDPFLAALATQACLKENVPFYPCGLENGRSPGRQPMGPGTFPCSLIIPYAINEDHVIEVTGMFSKQKAPITQVIAMVEESPIRSLLGGQTKYASVSDWPSIQNRIKRFRNLTNEKMAELEVPLGRTCE